MRTKNADFRLPLQGAEQQAAILPAQQGEFVAQRFPGLIEKQRQQEEQRHHDAAQRCGELCVQPSQTEGERQNDHQRRNDWRDDPQIKVV